MALSNLISLAPVLAVGNPIVCQADPDAAWASATSYWVDLLIEGETAYRSGTWAELLTLREFPVAGQPIVFTPESLLEGQLSPDLVDFNALLSPSILSRMATRIRFTLKEYTNDIETDSQVLGISHVIRAAFNQYNGQALNAWRTANKFLTHQPATKRSSEQAPEFLTFIASTTETIKLRMRLTYQDGSVGPDEDTAFSQAVEAYDVVRFPAGYQHLNLDVEPQGVRSWTVWLSDAGNNPISEEKSFDLDEYGCGPFPRYYCFEGSLGGFQTFVTTGEARVNHSPESNQVSRIRRHDAAGTDRARLLRQTIYTQQVDQYSGYLPADHAAWLTELAISEEVFRLGDHKPNPNAQGELVPINLDRESFPILEDNNFLISFRFSYEEAVDHRGV